MSPEAIDLVESNAGKVRGKGAPRQELYVDCLTEMLDGAVVSLAGSRTSGGRRLESKLVCEWSRGRSYTSAASECGWLDRGRRRPGRERNVGADERVDRAVSGSRGERGRRKTCRSQGGSSAESNPMRSDRERREPGAERSRPFAPKAAAWMSGSPVLKSQLQPDIFLESLARESKSCE